MSDTNNDREALLGASKPDMGNHISESEVRNRTSKEASKAVPVADERELDLYDEIECDLHYLFGRASAEGHESGQRLADQVKAKMQRARANPATSALEIQAVEELAQLGYTWRDGLLYPPIAQPQPDVHPGRLALSDHEIYNIASGYSHGWHQPSANARGSWMFYRDKVRDFARAILAASSGSKGGGE